MPRAVHSIFVVLIAAAVPADAQMPASPPKFGAVSIKRSASATTVSSFRPSPNGVTGTNIVPALLLTSAYEVTGVEIEGAPAWTSSERYDVIAKSDGNPSAEDRKLMLQALLADRFQLKAHKETKEAVVSFLTVVKSGLKVKPFDPGDCVAPDPDRPVAPAAPGQKPVCGAFRSGRSGGNLTLDSVGMTVETLIRVLRLMLGRNILDHTGVTGPLGALHLEFASTRLDDPNTEGPSIFAALQEVGLKLESGRAPVEFLVVDRMERPSEN